MTKTIQFLTLLLVLGAFCLPLVSCGKKASLDPPSDNQYPREYPSE